MAGTVGLVARGFAGYSGEIASFLGKSCKLIGSAFGHSFIGSTKGLLTNPAFVDSFVTKGAWVPYLAAGAISIPTAVINLTNFFEDGRRIKEIASGESNFYTSRDAAAKTWGLSALGLASSATLGITGAIMGSGASYTKSATNPLGLALTVGSGVLATGSLIARQFYKWLAIDLPFKANTGLGLLSMNRPVFRVEDPSSPYYMMSHLLEKTVENRELQDLEHGELGSEFGKKLERAGMSINNYLVG